jgi:hypothetical protein
VKIAILGSHSETRMRAPFRDPEWTVWACSPGNMGVLPRVDAWFEMHVPAQSETRPDDYIAYLRTLPLVYLRDENALPTMPGGRLYPDEMMKRRFGPFFFTSSIAYLLAFAIAQRPKTIGLWGVHMASTEEYLSQRPGCQYMIQRAWDEGIEIMVPPESRLLKPPADNW